MRYASTVMPQGEPRDFEDRLIALATTLELADVRTSIEDSRASATFRIDPDALSSAAWALIFALGNLSFATAVTSSMHEDTWSVGDMLENLLFENGRLFFLAASIRGRAMNTRIEVDQDGDVSVETTDRGTAVLDWILALQVRHN